VETWINVHYSFESWCIRAKYPSFNGRDLVVQPEFPTTFQVRTRLKAYWGVRLGPLIWMKKGGTVFLLITLWVLLFSTIRDRSLIMGGREGAVVEKSGAASTIFAWIGGGLKLKNMWQGVTQIFEYFSISRFYRIPQNISPFLVHIIVVSIVYYVYAVHHKSLSK
jgi:hypothetical protein